MAMRLTAFITMLDDETAAVSASDSCPAAAAYVSSGTWPSSTSAIASLSASAARSCGVKYAVRIRPRGRARQQVGIE
jgi:hypothetical protein